MQDNSTPKPCGDKQKVGAMLPNLQREKRPVDGLDLALSKERYATEIMRPHAHG